MQMSRGSNVAFAAVTALFLSWGFITALIDPLVAAVKAIFHLSNLEAQLSTFAFFIAYGLVSIPAAMLVARLRAVPSILVALAMMVSACLIMITASSLADYRGVLAGLFVLASGITILQVAANPLAAALGAPEGSHFRLTLSQAFNALGTVIGPLVGARLLLKGVEVTPGTTLAADVRRQALAAIDTSFLMIAGMILVLALFIWALRHWIEAAAPRVAVQGDGIGGTLGKVFASKWALLGGLAIFLYVGAEVAIGTQMALFLNHADIWNVSLQNAGYYVSLYWGGAMVGRFAGAALLSVIPAHRLLAGAAAMAAALCIFVIGIGGASAGYAALAIGLFNSIMFPTIFTLTLERSTAGESATAGFLCLSIVGGAVIPLVAGSIADRAGYTSAFIVPLLCYAALCGFAMLAARARCNLRVGAALPTLH
jgi:FHS family L-fucose permease-like MFS transporter